MAGILRAEALARAEGNLAVHVARRVVVADNVILAVGSRFAAADALRWVPDDLREVTAYGAGVARVAREVVAANLVTPALGHVGNREKAGAAGPDVLAVLVVRAVLEGVRVSLLGCPGVCQ